MNKTLHYIILLLVLNCSLTIKAQWQNGLWIGKQAHNWYFGDHAGLTFNTSPPSGITDSALEPDTFNISFPPAPGPTFIEGTGSISDSDGNTLFYTNGRTIWNANNEIMINGFGLVGDISSVQNGLIVPDPGNENLYYVFTLNYTFGLTYSKVDMSLDGGLGTVLEKNIQLSLDVEERISAVHHTDGKQIWIVTNSFYSNEIRSYLISENGINTDPVTTSIGTHMLGNAIGSMKFSPDGSKLALSRGPWFIDYTIEVFNFDKSTGEVTDLKATLGSSDFPGDIFGSIGVEFSPNGRFLYAASYENGTVYQCDTTGESEQDIKNSVVLIGQAILTSHWTMQLGPDGKIYLAHGNTMALDYSPYIGTQNTLNVINYPNNPGLMAGFEEYAVDLLNGRNDASIPVFIQSYFASGILHEGNCPNQDITFTTIRIPDITSINWDFGDPDSGEANISSEPVHAFSNPGTYTVTANITSNGVVQTATTEIIIIERPKAVSPSAEFLDQCADSNGNTVFNLSAFNEIILDGQDTDIFSVAYFATEADRIANNPIENIMEFTTAGQTIYAVVTNSETGCHTILPLNLVVVPLPIAGSIDNMELCGDMSAIFDLTQQTSTLLSGQDPNEFSVVYYTDENFTNEIQQPEQFESEGQTIYATVINNATGCTVSTDFEITLLQLPSLPEITTFQGCSPFNLISLVGTSAEGTTYSFYNTEEDAIEGVNPIPAAETYIVENNTGSVYIRVLNNMGCVQVRELLLEEGDCFIPRGISPNNDGKNDSFDLSGFGVEQITIFNRYGKQVYHQVNYSNEWIGQDSKGNELPTATYYYMIKLNTGESKTGWVYINRQN
ncbi:PKD domain protein [compost metagenome]